jgi:predicted amidohydrolase YtcJ
VLLVNGNVMTMDAARPRASAVAVVGERIAAVGSDRECRAAAGKGEVVDLHGKTLLPGFNDAHCHLLHGGRALLDVDCSPEAARDIDAIRRLIAERARTTPPGQWIVGHNYDVSKLAEGRHPTRQDLDAAAPQHPVFLSHVCTHIAIANSLGLARLGYAKESADPPGGRLGRDARGELTGRLDEEAMAARPGAPGRRPRMSPDDDRRAMQEISRRALRLGLTSASDAHIDPQGVRVLREMAAAGALPLRMRLLVTTDGLDECGAGRGERSAEDAWCRVAGGKIFADGAIAGRTACLLEPYEGTDDRGILAIEPDALRDQAVDVHRRGLQVCIHANGDRAIGLALDAIEAAMRTDPRPNPRHRLEHGTVMTPDLIARVKRLGVVVVPFASYVWHHGEKMRSYGRRIEMMFAHRSLIDAGVPVAGSTDYPCAPLNPLLGVQSCVLRQSHTGEPLGQGQRLSVEEAMRVYTVGSAYAFFDEAEKGAIRPGMLADLVVLGADPTRVDPMTIKDIPVAMAVVAGRVAYAG